MESTTICLDEDSKDLLLVRFSDNWADECDFDGFVVMKKTFLDEWESKIPEDVTVCFGTNECNEYNKQSFLQNVSSTSITGTEALVLRSLFPATVFYGGKFNFETQQWEGVKQFETASFGFFPFLY
jgi:hypothetical protein